MLLNGKSWILVQHPKLVKGPEQVTVEWLYRQIEMLNDGKWLIEGLGGLQPITKIKQRNIHRTGLVSIMTKHSELINLHPTSQFVSFKTEGPVSLEEAVNNKSLIIRRRCSEDVSLNVDLWEIDQVIGSVTEFYENHLFYRITGPEYIFVNSCLMENKSHNEEI